MPKSVPHFGDTESRVGTVCGKLRAGKVQPVTDLNYLRKQYSTMVCNGPDGTRIGPILMFSP